MDTVEVLDYDTPVPYTGAQEILINEPNEEDKIAPDDQDESSRSFRQILENIMGGAYSHKDPEGESELDHAVIDSSRVSRVTENKAAANMNFAQDLQEYEAELDKDKGAQNVGEILPDLAQEKDDEEAGLCGLCSLTLNARCSLL